ncbi:porin [Oceanomicrobium pacificus]|uniref:Porin n=1 Tax=Oceanomicrobium pacificus TaxID=2692916 RepID=A0A6B0TQ65_9RHOB|nr:porin [Oceanomicrobium pacificus]MXU64829.1 porin [Oceanomicrobium pacificus]
MKKALFATSALLAASVAGSAFAQGISFSGSAELGITNNSRDYVLPLGLGVRPSDDRTVSGTKGTKFVKDFDFDVAYSGTSDNGLSFGANADLDNNTVASSVSAFVSGGFGTITLGDTDGAYDKGMIEIAGGGIDDEASWENGHAGLDGLGDAERVLRYDFSAAGFTASLSAEIAGQINKDAGAYGDEIFGVGLGYASSTGTVDWGVGAGYQQGKLKCSATAAASSLCGTTLSGAAGGALDETLKVYGISGFVGFSGFTVNAAYEKRDADFSDAGFLDQSGESYGISGTYTTGAATIGAQYSHYKTDSNVFADGTGYGLWVDYDLGGGLVASVAAGQAQSSDSSVDDVTRIGAGLSMSF